MKIRGTDVQACCLDSRLLTVPSMLASLVGGAKLIRNKTNFTFTVSHPEIKPT